MDVQERFGLQASLGNISDALETIIAISTRSEGDVL
jgi:hypothetical protein